LVGRAMINLQSSYWGGILLLFMVVFQDLSAQVLPKSSARPNLIASLLSQAVWVTLQVLFVMQAMCILGRFSDEFSSHFFPSGLTGWLLSFFYKYAHAHGCEVHVRTLQLSSLASCFREFCTGVYRA